MNKYFWLLATLLSLGTSCSTSTKTSDILGDYRAEMPVVDGNKLPFLLTLLEENNQLVMQVSNAEDVIRFNEVQWVGDSIRIEMPPYDAVLMFKAEAGELKGKYLKEDANRKTPFYAKKGEQKRFTSSTEAQMNVDGTWKTQMRPSKPYPALGVFKQIGNEVTGTFRTNTGDYRFLEGIVTGDSLKLSTFDGAHPYLVLAKKVQDTIRGNLYYEGHSVTEFWMVQDPNYDLPDSKSLTHVSEGYKKMDFNFKDTQGNWLSFKDEMFKNKVVVVQIMGSWCPNCLDETEFFKEYLEAHKDQDLAFVGLSFEYAKTEEKAMNRVLRMKQKLEIPYPVLLAQFGSTNTELAREKLPMLDKIRSYPTSIVVDKSGTIVSIHTGFNGPATGEVYLKYKEEFDREIQELLSK